ncbi:MAG TPA: hypothetical protein VHX36_04900 [Candidatus Acidoferrales bacterium]|jgi:hypothetical protein|nr:hypothetical protein [Candidatus Acidoferrales bacterium]
MKSYKIAAEIAAALALAILFSAAPAMAQLTTSTPVVVRQTAAKKIWLKATVVHADGHSMVVREQGNQLALHTFTYSDNLQDAMRTISQAGGYQFGDKVKILYKQGQTVALRIKGKPSL